MITRRESGFALIITLWLLALLVLIVYAVSVLGKVGNEVAGASLHQTQARQHALLALHQAMGELQRYAGDDAALTGMAGMAGIPAGKGNPARHWCGVWDGSGQLNRWLVSGVNGTLIPELDGSTDIAILAAGSLGADGTDKEHVRVLRLPVIVASRDGRTIRQGSYAYWVGDEGVKLSAVIPEALAAVPGNRQAIDELIPALSPIAANLARVESFGQLAFVPATPLTPGQLQSNLHALGLTHYGYRGLDPVAGLLNVNTTTVRFWRGVAASYNRLKPADASPLTPTGFANWMRDHVALGDDDTGKAAGGPYISINQFLNSETLTQAVERNGGSVEEFGGVMRPWLTVRSDTFRIRAYGEALNSADPDQVEATAWCEAIVRRVKDSPSATEGRYRITYFRWLGPDDI